MSLLHNFLKQVNIVESLYQIHGLPYLDTSDTTREFKYLCDLTKELRCDDFKLNPYENSYFEANKITYKHLIERSNASISLNFISQYKGLPLHDNPNMVVIKYLLYGKLMFHRFNVENRDKQIELHDLIAQNKHVDIRYAKKLYDGLRVQKVDSSILSKGKLTYMTPILNNICSYVALEPSIMLHVSIPNHKLRSYFVETSNPRILRHSFQAKTIPSEVINYHPSKIFSESVSYAAPASK